MSHNIMQGISKRSYKYKSIRGCGGLCCTNCTTSTEETGGESSSGSSDRYATISSLAHFMVQERLDQMIKENEEEQARRTMEARRLMEARKRKQKNVVKNATSSSSSTSISNRNSNSNSNSNSSNKKLILMLAMEKSSHDPREDFRRSMVEVILANHIKEPKELRHLLKCYISMNSIEYRGIILEVFHQVCTDIFFCCKCHK